MVLQSRNLSSITEPFRLAPTKGNLVGLGSNRITATSPSLPFTPPARLLSCIALSQIVSHCSEVNHPNESGLRSKTTKSHIGTLSKTALLSKSLHGKTILSDGISKSSHVRRIFFLCLMKRFGVVPLSDAKLLVFYNPHKLFSNFFRWKNTIATKSETLVCVNRIRSP